MMWHKNMHICRIFAVRTKLRHLSTRACILSPDVVMTGHAVYIETAGTRLSWCVEYSANLIEDCQPVEQMATHDKHSFTIWNALVILTSH